MNNSRFKFRAWDKEFEEFVNPQYSLIGLKTKYIFTQWTGLFDKNGVDIYESDIVQVTRTNPYWKNDKVENHKVIFNNGCFNANNLSLNVKPIGNEYCFYYEVIGNIYENPELLETK